MAQGPIVKIVKYTEEKSNYSDVKVKEYHYRDSNNTKSILHHNQVIHIVERMTPPIIP